MKKHAKYVKEVLKKRKNNLSITKFQKSFNDEDACRNYLFNDLSPRGFLKR
jgi:hypothetical protein